MAGRVLSTDTAKQSIQRMQTLVNGSLQEDINSLDSLGQTLSDPNVWDGRLAEQFRGDQWPSMKSALEQLKNQLDELRANIQQINENIMTAGGE
jgi:uncharacterized protein YukE